MRFADYDQSDFAKHPLMFYYEVTRACDLVCKHCRASAQESSAPDELDTAQAMSLIDQVAGFSRKPTIVLTGGDPLKRGDIYDLIRHAVQAGLQVALTPSATPLATKEALQKAKDCGVRRFGISLDGADAETHDSFRGWDGSFERTLRMLDDVQQIGSSVQVNTTITLRNFDQIERMADLLAEKNIAMWSVFFLIPVGRGVQEERIAPQQYEEAFERLWIQSKRQPYGIKTTEAPHYRRFVKERNGDPMIARGSNQNAARDRHHRAPLGVRDGNGIMFVSHVGEIFPAGFLPLDCGRFPKSSVVDVYQNHPMFRALRDPDGFGGDCGVCEHREICGGSRSRAFAVTGDPLAAEPDCVHTPLVQLT